MRCRTDSLVEGDVPTQAQGSRLSFAYIATIFLTFASLLAPTLLCAVPATPMNAAERECCLQMRTARDCGQANMSDCCTPVAPNVAVEAPAVMKTSPALTGATLHHVAVVLDFVPAIRLVSSRIELQDSSPPPLTIPASIQVLRI